MNKSKLLNLIIFSMILLSMQKVYASPGSDDHHSHSHTSSSDYENNSTNVPSFSPIFDSDGDFFHADGLGSCSAPIDLSPLTSFLQSDIQALEDKVQGCSPKMKESISKEDNYRTYCSCISETNSVLNNEEVKLDQSVVKEMKESYYQFIGIGWRNKIASEITLMKELHSKDREIVGENFNISCRIEEDDPAKIAQSILDKLSCAVTAEKKKEVQQRLKLFLGKAFSDPSGDCDKEASLKDQMSCYIKKIQKENEKNYSDNLENGECFSPKEMQIASSQPSPGDLTALFSIVYGQDVSGSLVDDSEGGVSGDITKVGSNGLPEHDKVFENFDTNILKSLMHISHDTVNDFDSISNNKQAENIKRVKKLLVKNPKLYQLLIDPSTKKELLGDLYKKAKLTKIRDKKVKMKEENGGALSPKQEENLKQANKLLYVQYERYRKNKKYNDVILEKIKKSCGSGDDKDPSFEVAISNILCKKPEDLKLPPRYFTSRIKGMTSYNDTYCAKAEELSEISKEKLSTMLLSLEAKKCFDPAYEVAFCNERASSGWADGDIVFDNDGNVIQVIEKFISNVHHYLIDDSELLKAYHSGDNHEQAETHGHQSGVIGSPLLYKSESCHKMKDTFCEILKNESKCFELLGGGSDAKSKFRDCRTKFINDNYGKIKSGEFILKNGQKLNPQEIEKVMAILSQQYTQAQVCLSENKNLEGCVNENGTADVIVEVTPEEDSYLDSSTSSTSSQNSTTNETDNDILPTDHYSRASDTGLNNTTSSSFAATIDNGLNNNSNDDFYNNKFNSEPSTITPASTQEEMVAAVDEKIQDTKTKIEESKSKVSDLESKIKTASSDAEKESFQKQLEQESKYLASQESILKELQSMKKALADMKEENTSLKEQIANRYSQISRPESFANNYNNPANYQSNIGSNYVDKSSSGGAADVASFSGDSARSMIVQSGSDNTVNGNSSGQEDGGKGSVAGELSLNIQNLEQIVSSPLITVSSIKGFDPDPKLLSEIYNKEFGDVISVYEEATKLVHLYKFVDGKYIKTHEAQLINGVYVYSPVKKKEVVNRAIASEPEKEDVKRSVTREGLLDNLTQ